MDEASWRLAEKIRRSISVLETRDRVPDRIHLLRIVPAGMLLLAPYEKDGSVPSLDRAVNDGGPIEMLMNPDDFETMVSTVKPFAVADPRATPALFGIPVV